MDFVSHGLWGVLAVGRKSWRQSLYAFLWGIMPDVFSFGIFTIGTILGFYQRLNWSGDPHSFNIPGYISTLYAITHSLVIFIIVFGLAWLIFKKPILVMLAWPLHILVDIPSHSLAFYATPFLWPISNYRFDGIGWGHPIIYYPNLILLAICLIWLAIIKIRKQRKKKF